MCGFVPIFDILYHLGDNNIIKLDPEHTLGTECNADTFLDVVAVQLLIFDIGRELLKSMSRCVFEVRILFGSSWRISFASGRSGRFQQIKQTAALRCHSTFFWTSSNSASFSSRSLSFLSTSFSRASLSPSLCLTLSRSAFRPYGSINRD